MPCLGLATSLSGGHGTTHGLNVPNRGPFNKARAWSGLGHAGLAQPEFQDYPGYCLEQLERNASVALAR
jgi:hypothetical protein